MTMTFARGISLAALTLAFAWPAIRPCQGQVSNGGEISDLRVVISTTKGDIEGVLFASKVPMTVANFVNLAQRKYYDGIVFHRVIKDFMIQVGDPLTHDPSQQTRWGSGGPGYEFKDEIHPALRHDRAGIFSMANAGPGTNGSQFFITHGPTPHLNGKHTVFGAVTKGQDVVDAIQMGDRIVSIRILDDPSALLRAEAKNIAAWNQVLDAQASRARATR